WRMVAMAEPLSALARRYLAWHAQRYGETAIEDAYRIARPWWVIGGEEQDMPFESWVEIEAIKWTQKHQTPVSEDRPYYATEADWLRAEIGHLRGRLFDLETFWPDWGHVREKKWFLQQEIERLEVRLREVEEREQVRFRASGEGQNQGANRYHRSDWLG